MIGASASPTCVHLQPWEMLRPEVRLKMEQGRADLDRIRACMESPKALLQLLDEAGIERVAVINYVAPEVMGFTPEVNAWAARYCGEAPDRLVAFGSVHRPRRRPQVRRGAPPDSDPRSRAPAVPTLPLPRHRTGGLGQGIGEVCGGGGARSAGDVPRAPGCFRVRNVYADPMPRDDVAVDSLSRRDPRPRRPAAPLRDGVLPGPPHKNVP
jgi:hypothetical protein